MPGRPDRARRPCAPLQEVLDGTEWILHAATQDLPCLAELGLHPDRAVRHRARRSAARLPPGRPRHPRRDAARLPPGQGALGGRLVDPAAARAVAGVRRPRRRGARRAARRSSAAELVEAGKDEWARQEFDHLRGFEPAAAGRRLAAYLRAAQGPRPPRPRPPSARSGRPATRSPQQRDVTPGRILPDSAIVAAAQALPTDRAACCRPRASTAAAPTATPTAGSPRSQRPREMDEDDLPTRSPRGDGPPLPRAWAEKDPVAARRLSHRPRGDRRRSPRSSTCRSRTCSPPTTCAAPSGRRRPPATPSSSAAAVAEQLAGYGARPWQIELAGPIAGRRDHRRPRSSRHARAASRSRASTGPRTAHVGSGDATPGCYAPGRGPAGTSSSICSVMPVEVEHADAVHELLEVWRRTASSSSGQRVDQRRRSRIDADAELKKVGVRGPAQPGWRNVVGERDLEVGRVEVAGARPPRRPTRADSSWTMKSAAAGVLAASRRQAERRSTSPTVAAPSSTGIGITSKFRPGTCRSSRGQAAVARDHAELAALEPRRSRARFAQLRRVEGHQRVAQQLEGALERGPGVVAGERRATSGRRRRRRPRRRRSR